MMMKIETLLCNKLNLQILVPVSFLMYTTVYLSCFEVTSDFHDTLRPFGTGVNSSIIGDEGPKSDFNSLLKKAVVGLIKTERITCSLINSNRVTLHASHQCNNRERIVSTR